MVCSKAHMTSSYPQLCANSNKPACPNIPITASALCTGSIDRGCQVTGEPSVSNRALLNMPHKGMVAYHANVYNLPGRGGGVQPMTGAKGASDT